MSNWSLSKIIWLSKQIIHNVLLYKLTYLFEACHTWSIMLTMVSDCLFVYCHVCGWSRSNTTQTTCRCDIFQFLHSLFRVQCSDRWFAVDCTPPEIASGGERRICHPMTAYINWGYKTQKGSRGNWTSLPHPSWFYSVKSTCIFPKVVCC